MTTTTGKKQQHHIPELHLRLELPAAWKVTKADIADPQQQSVCCAHIMANVPLLNADGAPTVGSPRPLIEPLIINAFPAAVRGQVETQMDIMMTRNRSAYWKEQRSGNITKTHSFVATIMLQEIGYGIPADMAVKQMVRSEQSQLAAAGGMGTGANPDVEIEEISAASSSPSSDFFERKVEYGYRLKSTPSEKYRVINCVGLVDRVLVTFKMILRTDVPSYAPTRKLLEEVVLPSIRPDRESLDRASGRAPAAKLGEPTAFGLRPFLTLDVPFRRCGVGFRVRYPTTWKAVLPPQDLGSVTDIMSNAVIAGYEHSSAGSAEPLTAEQKEGIRSRLRIDEWSRQTALISLSSPPTPASPEGETAVIAMCHHTEEMISAAARGSMLVRAKGQPAGSNAVILVMTVQGKTKDEEIELASMCVRHPTIAGLVLMTSPVETGHIATPLWMLEKILQNVTMLPNMDALQHRHAPLLVVPRSCLAVDLGADEAARKLYGVRTRPANQRDAAAAKAYSESNVQDYETSYIGGHELRVTADAPKNEEDAKNKPVEARPQMTLSTLYTPDMRGGANFMLSPSAHPPATLDELERYCSEDLLFITENTSRLIGGAMPERFAQHRSQILRSTREQVAGREWFGLAAVDPATDGDPFGPRAPDGPANMQLRGTKSLHPERDVVFIFGFPDGKPGEADAFVAAHAGVLASVEIFESTADLIAKYGAPAVSAGVVHPHVNLAEASGNFNTSTKKQTIDNLRPNDAAQLLSIANDMDVHSAGPDSLALVFFGEQDKARGVSFKTTLRLAAYDAEPENPQVLLDLARSIARYYNKDDENSARANAALEAHKDFAEFLSSPLMMTVRAIEIIEKSSSSKTENSALLSKAWSQLAAALSPMGKSTVPLDFNRRPDPKGKPAVDVSGVSSSSVTRGDAVDMALKLDPRGNAEAWAMAAVVALSESDNDCFCNGAGEEIPARTCLERALQVPGCSGWMIAAVWYCLGLALDGAAELQCAVGATPIKVDDCYCFQQAREMEPEDPNVLFNLGSTLQKGCVVKSGKGALEGETQLFVRSIINSRAEEAGDAWISLSTTMPNNQIAPKIPVKNGHRHVREPIGPVEVVQQQQVEQCNRQVCLRHAIECRKLGTAERCQAFYNLALTLEGADGDNNTTTVSISRDASAKPNSALELMAVAVTIDPKFEKGWMFVLKELRAQKAALMEKAGKEKECDVPEPFVLVGTTQMTTKDVMDKIGGLEMKAAHI